MAIGHWASLAECQKLTQSQLIPGVIEEDVYRNNLLDRIPVAQARGQSIKWNREATVADSDIANMAAGDQMSWSASMTYSQQEVALKIKAVQRRLDGFIPDVYGTINDYEAQVLWEMKKAMIRRIGDDLLYDDLTYGSNEFDGLHALAAVQTGTDLDIDGGSVGFSLLDQRVQLDAMKHGTDFTYMPMEIGRRMDEAFQEVGLVSLASGTAGNMVSMVMGVDDLGKPIMYFRGVPIIRSDFMAEEEDGTGAGSNARAKYSSDKTFSVFNIKMGDVFNGEPGLCLGFGNTEQLGQFYSIDVFDKLENYIAGGLRLYTYLAVLLGSKLCLGRIYDVDDVAVLGST